MLYAKKSTAVIRTASLIWLRIVFLGVAALLGTSSFAAKNECVRSMQILHGSVANSSNDSHKASGSLDYFRTRINSNYATSNEDWFTEYAESSFARAIDEKLNWQNYFEHGLQPGERILWLQQGMLKELNDKLWDIGGTEYYLLNLDEVLSRVLEKNSRYGKIIHRNYKDRVVVTKLSEEEFRSLVLNKVVSELVTEISKIRKAPGSGWEWSSYVRQSLKLGSGDSLESAHFDLQLSSVGKTFDEWSSETGLLRKKLDTALHSKGLSLGEALKRARLYKGNIEALKAWLKTKGLPSKYAGRLLYYSRLTNIADFLPTAQLLDEADLRMVESAKQWTGSSRGEILQELPRFKKILSDSWDFRRATFIRDVKDSHFIVATDISGLGEKALMARDRWISEGADPSKISRVYDGTTEYLSKYYKDLHDELAAAVGGSEFVKLYASGDDALWGLPELTPLQHSKIQEIFKDKNDLYVLIKPIKRPGDADSVADAIFESRDDLFALKPIIKKEKFGE